MRFRLIFSVLFCLPLLSLAQPAQKPVIVGAERIAIWKPLVARQRVALVVNPTSMVGNQHLVDVMLAEGIDVKKVFAPEHGFRGEADAGAKIADGTDPSTGLPIVSLYGKNKKPSAEMLADIDVVVFDIQDVGARFYTYISTMHYVMEACTENNKRLIVLDRPNPNGDYVDGPVRLPEHESFVAMHPIPVVHGLTVGELARMINGEGWLQDSVVCDLTVVQAQNWDHTQSYTLPVPPSPNLPNQQAVRWYPSLCLLEGTPISIGRGTPWPFQMAGFPNPGYGEFTFRPVSIPGKSTYPKHQNQQCHGLDLREAEAPKRFSLEIILKMYQATPVEEREAFFEPFFTTLAGTPQLAEQIQANFSEEEIRWSWAEDLAKYKAVRKQYLLYPDFE